MDIEFYKYHGAGNDFVIVDDRNNSFPEKDRTSYVQKICERHFGVGSDGLILIQEDDEYDFYMEFFNPDGSQSFCGNGSRCAVMFSSHMGIIGETCTFNSIHGLNEGKVVDANNVSLKMFDVSRIEIGEGHHFIDTGSPHYNIYVDEVDKIDLIPFARNIRYNDRFGSEGTNVNIIQKVKEGSIKVRTYERGVENETLSCGTGVTACAISEMITTLISKGGVEIETKGGKLFVNISDVSKNGAEGILLTGPAKFVYKGEINV